MPWSSNATFLVQVTDGEEHVPAVYKPERGERPLWDFPCGLWRREVAASVLSEHLGFDLVPATVARHDAPLGTGSLQLFVPARFDEHYFTLRDIPSLGSSLRRLCAFDIVANSADRKAGHCLIDGDDHLWAIDNGLSFHAELKVRTVVWDFAGEPVPDDVADRLGELLDAPLPEHLVELLEPDELDALRSRTAALLGAGRFPHDPTGRRVPWPLV
ncbi:MAG: SCO1664 family protein [Actinobacteria bacterium]|nr:SCO1664 family protein [Actinomycetota bacterium]